MEVLVESPRRAARISDSIRARLQFALRRLSWLVPRATVRLSEIDAASPERAKRCEVRLKVVGSGDVVATAISRDWVRSIDDAFKAAARRLERQYRRTYAA